jgi:hypothetical protein
MVYVFKSWNQPLVEMQENASYIRPKVVGPFSGPCASGSFVHQADGLPFWVIQ